MARKGDRVISWSRRDPEPRRASVVALAVTVLLVVVVGTPRFAEFRDVDPDLVGLTDRYNGWDMSYEGDLDRDIRAVSFDVYSYHAYVEHFRGEFDRYPIFGPWRWRLLPSWVAAWLPIDNPADAYATVSMAFLAIGGAALVAAAARQGFGPRQQLATGALYAVSFPMLWYGTSGYVDGCVVAAICVGLYLVQSRRWWLFLAFLPIGFLVKETYLIIVPVAATYLWTRARSRRDWVPFTAASVAVVLVAWFGVRALLHTPRTLDWLPRWSAFSWNTSRPEAIGSFVLTCGVAVPLAVWFARRLVRARDDEAGGGREAFARNLHLIVGLGMGVAVALHGFAAAYADGRHAWTTYPFATILAVMAVPELLERRRAVARQESTTQ